MFRCQDCKKEYEIKPDYCDCGNDSFDEIFQEAEFFEEKAINKISFFEKYPIFQRFIASFDIVSTLIFGACLILSILPWIFWGKNLEKTQSHENKTEKTQSENLKKIPSINSFWDNTAVRIEAPKPAIIQQTPIDDAAFQREQMLEEIRSREAEQRRAPQSEIRTPRRVDNQSAILEAKIKKEKEFRNEFNTYKAGLRQTLFSRLAVGSVQGIGRCEVEFSVDNYGRLVHKRFSKLSDNKSLNDAVYSMLMSVSQYSPPPNGYNGEKIRLNFYFNNGYYEVGY